MRFKKSLLTAVSRLVLGLALFTQISVTAYACTPPSLAHVQTGMEGMPCHQGAGSGSGSVDESASKLCKQYCLSAQQTVEQFSPIVLLPGDLPVLVVTPVELYVPLQAVQVAALSSADPPGGPPLTILFSRFLN